MDRDDWDFFMIVYGVTDNMQHNLWPFLEPQHPASRSREASGYRARLFDYYEKVDGLCAELVAKAGPNTHVLVMSDHGFGSTRTNKYLSKVLMEAGWLHYKGLPVAASQTTRLMQRLLDLYHRYPLLANLVRRLSGRQKLGLKHALTRASLLPAPENVDWDRTIAFPGGYGLQVYVNRQDRFARGTVAPGAEYEAVLDRIVACLLAVTDPVSGEPIYKAVHRAQDLYRGEFAGQAPDLIVEYANVYQAAAPAAAKASNPGLEGNHTLEGILIAHGPDIRPVPVASAQIMDLAPTILYLLGLPVPANMDGRVLSEILDPARLAAQPIRLEAEAPGPSLADYEYTPEEAELVREQLRALGYIE
jgi:predicted AlkP superfamily phosphohydrolase/phosphomutase